MSLLAKNRLVFSYPNFPPEIFYSTEAKSMDGRLAPLIKACLASLDREVETIELPVRRYRLHLQNGLTDIALGNKVGKKVMQASIFGQVPIGSSVVGYYSLEKESISIDQMRNKIIGAIRIYNYGSLRKQLSSPEKNNQFSELKYQNQGFELLRQQKIDLFLTYLNHEVKEDISDLYPHKLKQH